MPSGNLIHFSVHAITMLSFTFRNDVFRSTNIASNAAKKLGKLKRRMQSHFREFKQVLLTQNNWYFVTTGFEQGS